MYKYVVSLRPNYIIFIGYLKQGVREGVQANPLNPILIRHWLLCTCDRYQGPNKHIEKSKGDEMFFEHPISHSCIRFKALSSYSLNYWSSQYFVRVTWLWFWPVVFAYHRKQFWKPKTAKTENMGPAWICNLTRYRLSYRARNLLAVFIGITCRLGDSTYSNLKVHVISHWSKGDHPRL